jgi:hypothetical protein
VLIAKVLQARLRQSLFFGLILSSASCGSQGGNPADVGPARDVTAIQHVVCGFRGKAGGITGSIRSALRNGSDHDYGMNPIADSDFKPITWGHLSEP